MESARSLESVIDKTLVSKMLHVFLLQSLPVLCVTVTAHLIWDGPHLSLRQPQEARGRGIAQHSSGCRGPSEFPGIPHLVPQPPPTQALLSAALETPTCRLRSI